MLPVLLSKSAFLLIFLGAQIMRPFRVKRQVSGVKYERVFVWGFVIAVFFTFFISGYLTYQQYNLWQSAEFSRLFLPPHQPISYFFQYSFTNFWMGPLIAFATSLAGLFSAKALNKKFQERFFWPEEPWLFATALLLTGHPGWIFYAIAVVVVYLVWQIFQKIFFRKPERVSTYYFWLPVAIGVIIISWFKFL